MSLDLAVVALLAVGAAARLTRLVSMDVFPPARKFREWTVRRFGDEHWIPELVYCPWCIGFWISGAVGASAWLWGDTLAWQIPASLLALSFVVSALVVATD